MKLFSLSWKSSRKQSKQRKYRLNAPLHLKRDFVAAPLTKDLGRRYSRRAIPVREGDTAKVVRGEFKGVTGKISSVNLRRGIVYVDGAGRTRKDGTKALFPLRPSNLLLTELSLEDKRRASVLMRKVK